MINNDYKFWSNSKSIDKFNNKQINDFFASEKHLLSNINNRFLNVVDLGCATGNFIELLKKNYYKFNYLGIDLINEQINLARDKYRSSKFKFINHDIFTFKTSQKYDLVNSTGVFQHTLNFKKLLNKMINLSSNYVMFDVKFADIGEEFYLSTDSSYIVENNVKIPYVIFSKRYFINILLKNSQVGHISYYGYKTFPNKNVTLKKKISEIYSVGFLLKKKSYTNNKKITGKIIY